MILIQTELTGNQCASSRRDQGWFLNTDSIGYVFCCFQDWLCRIIFMWLPVDPSFRMVSKCTLNCMGMKFCYACTKVTSMPFHISAVMGNSHSRGVLCETVALPVHTTALNSALRMARYRHHRLTNP